MGMVTEPAVQTNRKLRLTCEVLVDGLHLALGSDERLLDDAVLLLLQVLHLRLQLTLSSLHLSFIDQDLEGGCTQVEASVRIHTRAHHRVSAFAFICTTSLTENI